MKLDVKKTLTGGEFKVSIAHKSYEVFEEGLMEDFGVPELKIPVSTWGAKATEDDNFEIFKVNGDSEEADCTIDLNQEIVAKLNNAFKVEYAVKITDIEEEALKAPLDTVVKMCEAKCGLFIEVIKAEAKAKMDALRAMKTDFEAAIKNPEVIRI